MKGYREVANYFLRVFLVQHIANGRKFTKRKLLVMIEKKKHER